MENSLIINKLDNLSAQINALREEMHDFILTREDLISIEEAEDDFENGRTISLENLKCEFDL